jgi:hypothetical protein
MEPGERSQYSDYSAGLMTRVLFPAEVRIFICHRVQIGSGAHPASYPMCTRGSFPGSKAAGA